MSGVGRELSSPGARGIPIKNVIQTDAGELLSWLPACCLSYFSVHDFTPDLPDCTLQWPACACWTFSHSLCMCVLQPSTLATAVACYWTARAA